MKPLYYLEFAQSVKNGVNIPAKKLRWKTKPSFKTAWEDPCLCWSDRIELQKQLSGWVVRMTEANWLKNISIRLNSLKGTDWVLVKESK